jgi:predicted RNA-binding Zn-ribbon protein involved in translation (DUF1610 family)
MNAHQLIDSAPHVAKKPVAGVCPACGVTRLYRSHRRKALDWTFSLIGARPRRCHACDTRFFRLFNWLIPYRSARRFARKLGAFVLIVAAAAIVALILLSFGAHFSATPPPDPNM